VITARYALSPYIKQICFVSKALTKLPKSGCDLFEALTRNIGGYNFKGDREVSTVVA
jgi:hypothetical protein